LERLWVGVDERFRFMLNSQWPGDKRNVLAEVKGYPKLMKILMATYRMSRTLCCS